MRRKALVIVFVVSAFTALAAADGPYSVVKEIKIGGPGGWDYITVDPAAHRVYVSHATKIVVADADSGNIVGEIADTPGVHWNRGCTRSRAWVHQQRPRQHLDDRRSENAEAGA
jgi:hypothetical protein